MAKKTQSVTKPHQRKIKTKAGTTTLVAVKGHVNKLARKKK